MAVFYCILDIAAYNAYVLFNLQPVLVRSYKPEYVSHVCHFVWLSTKVICLILLMVQPTTLKKLNQKTKPTNQKRIKGTVMLMKRISAD